MKKNVFLTKAIFYDENSGFVIFQDKNGETFKGNINLSPETFLGIEIEFEGEYKEDKYGKAFIFKNFNYKIDDIALFLKEMVKYVPKNAVDEIVKEYKTPAKIINAIETKEEKLFEIKGITENTLNKIYKSFKEKKEILPLASKFLKFGFSEYVIKSLYSAYGNQAYEKILQDPYVLTELQGFGFKKTDDLAIKIGTAFNNPQRYKKGVLYAIEQAIEKKGDTLISEKNLLDEAYNLLSVKNGYKADKIKINNTVKKLIQEGELIEIDNKISLKKMFIKEKFIYEKLFKAVDNFSFPFKKEYLERFLIKYQKKENLVLSEEQKKAIANFATTSSSVFVLSGSAGTGKTTVSKAVIALYEKAFKYLKTDYKIQGCALSGCAANRLKNVAKINAKTIHSILKFNGKEFFYNEKNKLPLNFLIIDEASMIDVNVFYSLLKAIDFSKTKLFLIGDNAQLPPVGAGEIFNDLIKYGNVPKIELKQIFRQSDDKYIKVFASYIRKAVVPEDWYLNRFDYIFDKTEISNYFKLKNTLSEKEMLKLRKKNYALILEKIKGYLSLYKNIYSRLLKERDYLAIVELVQILSPMNKYDLGVDNLNKIAQDILNPENPFKTEIKTAYNVYRVGDKVIHTQNINKKVRKNNQFENMRVYNGQSGIITDIKEKIEVYYPYEEYYVYYKKNELNKILKLGYALSIHKAQGNQYNNVIMPISNAHYVMLNNKILYTAVTRAINKIIMIGESYALKNTIKRKDETKRETFCKILSLKEKPCNINTTLKPKKS